MAHVSLKFLVSLQESNHCILLGQNEVTCVDYTQPWHLVAGPLCANLLIEDASVMIITLV